MRNIVLENFDTEVRLTLFREFVRTAECPSIQSLAETLGASVADVGAAMERLAAGKAIVLQPESREVLMANPLSAVPTPYRVRIDGRSYFGACIWDALGILAMLPGDGVVDSSCGCCGESMSIRREGGTLASAGGIIHFALPAKTWWQNIVFT